MPRILLVEKSTTLRHALARQLAGDRYDVEAMATYEEALARLRDPAEQFHAVVLGWPERAASITDELLVLLEQAPYGHLGVVALSDGHDVSPRNWITQRPGAALLLWEEYREISAVLASVWRKVEFTEALDATVPGEAGDTRGIRILLVDDSPTSRYTYRNLLTQNGYAVEMAASVEEGFERAAAGGIDIAIIDYFMPGQTGDELCRRLREDPRTRDITNSVLTGTYIDHVIADSLSAGAVECMFKNEAHELFLARVAAMSRAVRGRRFVERERRHLEGILEAVGDGVYGVDTHGRVSFMNPVARGLLGYGKRDRIAGEDARQLFHYIGPDGRYNTAETCFLTRAYASGEPLDDWKASFRKRDGTPLPVEGTIYPLVIDGGRCGSVVAFRDVTERQLLEDQLRWQANHDSLTKLLNRHYFEEELQNELQRVARSGRSSGLVFLDLDQFKYINDTAGHAAGDRLLVEVAQRLSARLRSADTLARLGGDEFALLLREVPPERLFETADAYRELLSHGRFAYDGRQYVVTASVGVAAIEAGTLNAGEAMARADLAAHVAKYNGRNQTHLFSAADDDRAAVHRDLGWSTRLKRAFEDGGFELAFQPVVPAVIDDALLAAPADAERWSQLRSVLGPGDGWQYEALVRLRDDGGRLVLPGAFLPAAERFSLMPAIDRWVIEQTISMLGTHGDARSPAPCVAINLSAESLVDRDLAATIVRSLERHGVDGHLLSFEITETSAVTNLDAAQRLIGELSSAGCRFALDDFGSGFCSFGQLKHLDVDYIKIDGLFIQGLVADPLDRQVVLAINQIAHSLGKATVAEVVETPEALALARECGVDYVQGHCIAAAMASVPDLPADFATGALSSA